MSKILVNSLFPAQIAELGTIDFDISESRGAPVLEQTKKNNVRRELLDGLRATLDELLGESANVYNVKEGVAVEIDSEAVRTKVPNSNGMISFVLDIKFKNLEYDAYNDADEYAEECDIKAAKAAASAEKKRAALSKKAATKKTSDED